MNAGILLCLVILLPLIGGLFVLNAKDAVASNAKNARHTALLTVFSNILLILFLFSYFKSAESQTSGLIDIAFVLTNKIEFIFGADLFALVFVFGVQIAVFVGVLGVKKENQSQKGVLFFALCYLSMTNGYFFARDICSFYICFCGQLFPLYMLMCFANSEIQNTKLFYLFGHYFLGAALLFASFVLIMHTKQGDVLIEKISSVHFSHQKSIYIWGGIFLALMLRMPVWPFYHALTSVSVKLTNSLALIALNFLPLSGVYALTRYWPLDIPVEIELLSPIFQILCIVTMLVAAFGGFIYSNTSQKIHHYIFVYDLLYLLAVFLPTDVIKMNIAYSVFAFLLMGSCLIVLQSYMQNQSLKTGLALKGILCHMPKASLCYFLFVLAAIGLPVSAFFWNNFLIVSEIFNYHLYAGTAVIFAMTMAAVSLLEGAYELKTETCLPQTQVKIKDIDIFTFCVCILIMSVLLVSVVRPLWFVF